MGMTIHYRLAQEAGFVKATLDRAQRYAEFIREHEAVPRKIPFSIKRLSDTKLFIDIGNCETLGFDFRQSGEFKKEMEKNGWNYQWAVLNKGFQELDTDPATPHYKKYPEQILLWTMDFCKTQFAGDLIEHRWVANIIRSVAKHTRIAYVMDEGDYYHDGKMESAENTRNAIIRVMKTVTGKLKDLGYNEDQIGIGKVLGKQPIFDEDELREALIQHYSNNPNTKN